MTVPDIILSTRIDPHDGDDLPLAPPPAQRPMPIRRVRTVAGMTVGFLTGLALSLPAPFRRRIAAPGAGTPPIAG
ncbi:MAG: hypothetical protein NXI18_18265 [Alphaproteobacteria bacterium]|nr:hypothetical protein [Alphaproteobacteria bacterium]